MHDKDEFKDRLREAIEQERAKLKEEHAKAEAARLAKTRAENLTTRAVALLGEWTFARLEIAAGTISTGARLSKSGGEKLKWSSCCEFPAQKAAIEFSITGDESRKSLSVIATAVSTEASGGALFSDTFAVSVLESHQGDNVLYDSMKVHSQIDRAVRALESCDLREVSRRIKKARRLDHRPPKSSQGIGQLLQSRRSNQPTM